MPAPSLRNHCLELAYDGSRFHGWQVQPGLRTVQGVLEEALGALFGQPVTLAGSGRTDAGVHALRQVATFVAPPVVPVERLPYILNTRLGPEIRVLAATLAAGSFHARISARSKVYRYQVWNRRFPPPVIAGCYHAVAHRLDVAAMRQAAGTLIGTHDFRSFTAHVDKDRNHVRTVIDFRIHQHGPAVYFRVEATGFLHHMVRNMVGTLLEVGGGRRSPAEMATILAAHDRALAGPTAPGHGLFLVRVRYRHPDH